MVCSVCSTAKLVGLFSLMKVIDPLPSALMASIVAGLNVTVSTPMPVGWAVIRKKDVILGVKCQAASAGALRANIVVRRDGHALRVHYGNVGLVRDVDINSSLAVAHGLLGRSSQIKSLNEGTFRCVDHRCVRRLMA